ncbi:WAG22 antigen isoform X1 [Anopheles funestus]|uniref:WAG22 antigen isoform X1 n=1 Tax=Anopheles funestus TaxID=62324 RepID=UPI0020C67B77|nr:WAG22 antigen isoform X1 [Anopheles funestus]
MLSYMLPVEEKSPSAAAAAATRNLSLNLTTTTTATATGGGGSGGGVVVVGGTVSTGGAAGATIVRECNAGSGSGAVTTASTSSVAQVRSIIKPTIKHGANHRYQLIGGGSDVKTVGAGAGGAGVEVRQTRWQDEPDGEADLCDESTNLLSAGGEDEDDDEREAVDGRSRHGGAVKSDKNFNNLILVTNGRHAKPTNGNHAGPTPKLASVLKPTNGVGSAGPVRPGSSSSNSGTGGNHTSTGGGGAYYNGYIAVSGENDDEHHRLLVSANNLRNTCVEPHQEWNAHSRTGSGEGTVPVVTDLPRSGGTFTSSTRTNGNCRTMNSLNGNLMGSEPPAVAPLPLEPSEIGGGAADVSLGSDSDSATGAGGSGSATTGGGKKVKLNKLGGNKNVTLKRVSFGSSKGSMVETLVFETPTPLPEHAEREFFQSPAVLAGAGHTTVYSGGSGPPGNLVHHHYPTTGLSGMHHPHHHAPHHHHHHQYHPQYSGGYHPLDGGTGTGGPHDDSGIELQEEVERSKVRVSFFQSSKPQSISPPESLHLYGGQSLIHFGSGGTGGSGGVGGYDNNNSPLDTYITSAALNQQYDSLTSHQQQHAHFHPDHRDPNMAAVYGGTNVPPTVFNRQMSTESGWDNPFRPGGDLSREADEIVNLIKGGKPITPTGDQSLVNGSTPKDSHSTDDPDTTVVDGAITKHESSQLQAAQQNGTKSPHKSPGAGATGSPALAAKNGTTTGADGSTVNSSTTPISNQVIPGPQSASHVVIDEKKKKKCTCCVIQ